MAPNYTKNATIYEVNLRQYTLGGTFAEFERHLPRLKDLGVDILWFMPVQPIGKLKRKGSLGSYYSISNYCAVNPQYGTLSEFKNLVKKIHEMGMYVLLDWVANHTAWDHHWTIDHPDFYYQDQGGNFLPPFPEWADVIHLNYNNQQLRREMIKSMRFWIEEADIDGFRCDMAHLVPTDFWDQARPELDKAKKMFMLAESENRDLLVKAFDIEYNWNIFHLFNGLAKQQNNVHDLDRALTWEVHNYPKNAYQLLFTSNHDENSWNGSAIERLHYGLEALNILAFTLAGMPLIYSGQEAGCVKRLMFFEKDLIEWKEDKLFPFYKKLISLRHRNKALWSGENGGKLRRVYTNKDQAIFAFFRKKEENTALIILNLSFNQESFFLKDQFYEGNYTNVFTNEKITIHPNHELTLKEWGYLVLEI